MIYSLVAPILGLIGYNDVVSIRGLKVILPIEYMYPLKD